MSTVPTIYERIQNLEDENLQQLMVSFEKQLSSKVDRLEFTHIVQNKANNFDLQVLISQIMRIDQLASNEKLQNLLNESVFLGGQNTSPRSKVEEDEGYEEELEHLEMFERQQQTIKRSTDRMALNDISSINENDMNLNQSALREALQTRTINESSTPTKIISKANNVEPTSAFSPRMDQTSPRGKIQDLNAKIDEIYSSLCNLINEHCVSKQDLAKFILSTETSLSSMDKELLLKANKKSVANALHRKANKEDLMYTETSIVQKLEKVLVDIKGASEAQKEYTNKIEGLVESRKKDVEKKIKKLQEEIGKKHQQSVEKKGEVQQDITKFFRNYALQLFGSTVLETENQDHQLGLKTIFDKIFENQFEMFDIDAKFEQILTKNTKNMQNLFNDQLTEEIEELQLQINSLRTNKKNSKTDPLQDSVSPSDLDSLKKQLSDQVGLLSQKADIKDVCSLVDLKANSQDVFKIFDELKKSMQFVSSQKQSDGSSNTSIDNFIKEQRYINENLCPLNCVAQYIWHGGFNLGSIAEFNTSGVLSKSVSSVPKAGGQKKFESIKWSKETINTSPQSMELENDQIILSQEGIYEISFILFVTEQSKPQITMLLDNRQILSTLDQNSSFVCHQEAQKQITFTSFVNAERINQKLSFTIYESQTVKSLNDTMDLTMKSSSSVPSNSIFSSAIQTRKNNILLATSGLAKTVECSLNSQYYFSPDLTRAVLIVKKL